MIDKFHRIDVKDFESVIPHQLNNPFVVEVHPLAQRAVENLQQYLSEQKEWAHDFGLGESEGAEAVGKMFGVLVVENDSGEIGYLAAFSGKLADGNHWSHFVPPIYDVLEVEGFFKKGETEVSAINHRIEDLYESEEYKNLKLKFSEVEREMKDQLESRKAEMGRRKQVRQEQRRKAEEWEESERIKRHLELNRESKEDHLQWKRLKKEGKLALSAIQESLDRCEASIRALKMRRKRMSNDLQKKIFDEYVFFNEKGAQRKLLEIFESSGVPPSGAGECAAPKLFQYAFKNDLKPISLAEFWWGKPPVSQIRKHGHFYPSCRGKCGPILQFMLSRSSVESLDWRPLDHKTEEIRIIYEDSSLLVISKPAGLLSVPGRYKKECVWTKVKESRADLNMVMMVHRLDMSTSGVMVLAKGMEVYKKLQKQFVSRTVEKRYLAVLKGSLSERKGCIDLPLRVDLEDRPRQLVCFDHGKSAITRWEYIEGNERFSKVYFYPETGRTHQLRVHAAHHLGLGVPIVGDELYGEAGDRLLLHAERLGFEHPETKQWLVFLDPINFSVDQ